MIQIERLEKIEKKKSVFEYFVFCIEKWKTEIDTTETHFSKLQLQKLLFLASSVEISKKNHSMLDIFDNFYALKYGPVEMDIYDSMQNNDFVNLNFEGNNCSLNKNQEIKIAESDKSIVETAVCKLREKNELYVVLSPFTLVELTHGWTVWQISMAVATLFGNKKEKMSTEDIISSTIKTF